LTEPPCIYEEKKWGIRQDPQKERKLRRKGNEGGRIAEGKETEEERKRRRENRRRKGNGGGKETKEERKRRRKKKTKQ
jgi:hypothetical protein